MLEQSADSLLSDPLGIIHGGGLRGGWFHETRNAIALHDVVFIQGVHVSGDVTEGGAARLQISGPAASPGHVRLAHGRVTGVLGGRRINGALRSLSQPGSAAFAAVYRALMH